MSWAPFALTVRVTLLATLLTAVTGITGAYVLAKARFRGRRLIEAVASVPIVLPPTVLGYYLLVSIGRDSALGRLWERVFGEPIVFTWKAAVVAAWIASLPFCLRAARSAIASVDPRLEQAARAMGLAEWRVAMQVTLPLARRGVVAGLALAFARALGEFGATLMIAGNIPGRTQTMSLAVYDAVQAGDQTTAARMSLILAAVAVAALVVVHRFEQR